LFNSKVINIREQIIPCDRKVKKLGLTGYEAQAYLALLKLGDAEAGEIAGDAKIPMGGYIMFYPAWKEMHLVRSQETRPRRYTYVEPSPATYASFAKPQRRAKTGFRRN